MTENQKHPPRDRLLSLRQVQEIAGLRRTKLYELIGQGRFPRQIKIDGRSLWSERAVLGWVSDRVAEAEQTSAAAE